MKRKLEVDFLKKGDLISIIEIGTVKDLYEQMLFFRELDGYIFRGHSNKDYELRPTLLRGNIKGKYKKQVDLCLDELRRLILFFREANGHGLYVPNISAFYQDYLSNGFGIDSIMKNGIYRWLPQDIVELGVLAQHYGVKTRFLDWSFDWKVALYFACSQKNSLTGGGGAIWCINARWLHDFKKMNHQKPELLATFMANNHPDNHEEKRRIIELIQDDSIPICFQVAPYKSNQNLYAQRGVLSLWQHNIVENKSGVIPKDLIKMRADMSESLKQFFESEIDDDCKTLDDLVLGYFNHSSHRIKAYRDARNPYPVFLKFEFPDSLKEEFLRKLKNEGYDQAKIFPGYGSIAEMVNALCDN